MTASTGLTAVSPPLIGFKYSQEWTDVGDAEGTLPPFALGTRVVTKDGGVWRFVKAAAAKTAGLIYVVDEDWVVGGGLTTTLAAEPIRCGIPYATSSAPTAIDASASYTFFWLQTGGDFPVITTAGAVTANIALYTTATAGKVDDASTATILVHTLTALAALTAAGTTTGFSAEELHITGV